MASYCHVSDMNKMQKNVQKRKITPHALYRFGEASRFELGFNKQVDFPRKMWSGTQKAKENIPKGIIEGTSQSWGSEKYIQEMMVNHLMNTRFT